VGYVTCFEVDDAFAQRFAPQVAGGSARKELWVPAEELGAFNEHINGEIAVVATYRNGAIEPST
jgi:hypothetical protein